MGISLVLVALTIAGKNVDDLDSFHDFEHIPGHLTLLLRLVCGIVVIVGSWRLPADPRATPLLRRLLFLGVVYFCVFPVAVFCATLFVPEHRRHPFVTILVMLVQGGTLVSMHVLLLSPTSSYAAVAQLARAVQDLPQATRGSSSAHSWRQKIAIE